MEKLGFNPDEFILSKSDILFFTDALIKYWSKHPVENAATIVAARASKAAIMFQKERAVQQQFQAIIKIIHHLEMENSLAHAFANGEKFADTISKLKKKIDENGIEAILND